jgi:inner membrane protein
MILFYAINNGSTDGMYLLGHVGLALVAAALTVRVAGVTRRSAVGLSVLVLFATAPDVDLFVAGLAHRGVTHTVWAALALGTVFTLSTRVVRYGRQDSSAARFAFALGTASVLIHLVGDALTPMGIRPLHPLVGTTYTLDIVSARNPTANLTLFCVGVLAVALAVRSRDVESRRPGLWGRLTHGAKRRLSAVLALVRPR